MVEDRKGNRDYKQGNIDYTQGIKRKVDTVEQDNNLLMPIAPGGA